MTAFEERKRRTRGREGAIPRFAFFNSKCNGAFWGDVRGRARRPPSRPAVPHAAVAARGPGVRRPRDSSDNRRKTATVPAETGSPAIDSCAQLGQINPPCATEKSHDPTPSADRPQFTQTSKAGNWPISRRMASSKRIMATLGLVSWSRVSVSMDSWYSCGCGSASSVKSGEKLRHVISAVKTFELPAARLKP